MTARAAERLAAAEAAVGQAVTQLRRLEREQRWHRLELARLERRAQRASDRLDAALERLDEIRGG